MVNCVKVNIIMGRVMFYIMLIIIIIIISLGIFVAIKNKTKLELKVNSKIKSTSNYIYNIQKQEKQEVVLSKNIMKLQELQKVNSDIVALIKIEGTNINYPVMQGEDNSYYMTHNYKKQKSKDGAIFLDKDYDWSIPSTNLLIYGHNNIGSNEMFAGLMKYKRESFYNKHKIIDFITNEEEEKYEIISVFLSRVYYKHEKNVFRYYYFINANSKQDLDNYINNCKKASLYKINTTATYGNKLMTLSTCEYSRTNGRLVVVAKKVE